MMQLHVISRRYYCIIVIVVIDVYTRHFQITINDSDEVQVTFDDGCDGVFLYDDSNKASLDDDGSDESTS